MLLLRQARSYRRDYVTFLQRGLGQGKLRPAALTDSKALRAAREALAKEEPQLREALQRAEERLPVDTLAWRRHLPRSPEISRDDTR